MTRREMRERLAAIPPAGGPPRVDLEADLVARRLVMTRETWDRVVRLAAEVSQERGLTPRPDGGVWPTDVATLALEAGLDALKAARAGPRGS